MGYRFRHNATTYELYSSTAKIASPSFAYRRDGSTYYVPLLTSRSQTIGDYNYDASTPTRCFRSNGTTYYAAKSRTLISVIPAGTYTPATFRTLIGSMISMNGTRLLALPVTATVNGQTATFPAGNVVKYSSAYNGETECVSLTGDTTTGGWDDGISWSSSKAIYCVYNTKLGHYKSYSNYPITLANDIKFL